MLCVGNAIACHKMFIMSCIIYKLYDTAHTCHEFANDNISYKPIHYTDEQYSAIYFMVIHAYSLFMGAYEISLCKEVIYVIL